MSGLRTEWLEISQKGGETVIFRKWCKDAKKKNHFATSGSGNIQKSALDTHALSNPEHLDVVQARSLRKSKHTVKDVIDVQEKTRTAERLKSKVGYCMILSIF